MDANCGKERTRTGLGCSSIMIIEALVGKGKGCKLVALVGKVCSLGKVALVAKEVASLA